MYHFIVRFTLFEYTVIWRDNRVRDNQEALKECDDGLVLEDRCILKRRCDQCVTACDCV